MENRDLGSPDTVVIHAGTNDLRRTVFWSLWLRRRRQTEVEWWAVAEYYRDDGS
jgi:hypothetical protein